MTLRAWAHHLKRDTLVLWIAARDARVPWYAKVVAGFVAAYALSPIDLVPDFIPVIGHLDDLLIVPAGIWLALKLIPPELIEEFRQYAQRRTRPRSYAAAVMIVALWIAAAAAMAALILR